MQLNKVITFINAILVILLVLHVTLIQAEGLDDSDADHLLKDKRFHFGFGFGIIQMFDEIIPKYNLTISYKIFKNYRIGLATLLDLDKYSPRQDSSAFDYEDFISIGIQLETDNIRIGNISLPIGININFESAVHNYRLIENGSEINESDDYFVLEPWIGIGLKKKGGKLNNILNYLRLALGYRFAISPDLPGYEQNDFSGLAFYMQFRFPL
jgi:hypothetical protein